jgi:putative flippase GtrA
MVESSFFIKMIKFGMVGISGMAIDFGFTSFFKEILTLKKYISNSIGFTTAATSNYFFNRLWTFQSTTPDITFQIVKFFIIALLGLLINNIIVYYFTDLRFRINFYISKGLATFTVFFWNFIMNYFLTF